MKDKKLSLKKVFALLVSVILLASFLSFLVWANPDVSYDTYIVPGSMNKAASYIVFQDGSTYYALNGQTGQIDIESSTASTVLQYAFDNHGDGLVFVKAAVYHITETLNVTTSNFHLQGEVGSCWHANSPASTYYGTELRGDGSTFPLIRFQATDSSRLERLQVDHIGFNGKASSYVAANDGLYFYNCAEVWVHHCEIYQMRDCGITLQGSGELQWVMYNDITGNYGHGIETDCRTTIKNNHLWINRLTAIYCTGQGCMVTENIVIEAYQHGIVIATAANSLIANNDVRDCDYLDTQSYNGLFITSNSHNCTVTGNRFLNNDQYDILIDTGVEYTLCTDNNCNSWTNQAGIRDKGTNSEIHSCWNGTSWVT